MAYQVIARKWRPQTFEELVGQEHVVTTLRNAIAQGRIAHAYLFTGIRGVGKTSAARILAKALNCQEGPTPTPCNRCASCRAVTEGSSMDVIEIDGASNRGVDNIRELREQVAFAASSGRYKVYIIDEVHMLTNEAFNALLKTLEEPPAYVVFVLATTELHKVPATILSRCQVFEFRRIGLPDLVAHLRHILEAEHLEAQEEALRMVAREADGSLRDACSLLDQVIGFAGGQMTVEAVSTVLRTGHQGLVEDLLSAVLGEDPAGVLRGLTRAFQQGLPARQLLQDMARHLSQCLRLQVLGPDASRETGLTEGEISGMQQRVGDRPVESLATLLHMLVQAADRAADSRSPDLVAEAALVRAARLSQMSRVEELVTRLEDLARGIPGGTGAGAVPPLPPVAALPRAAPSVPRPSPASPQPRVAPPASSPSSGGAVDMARRLQEMAVPTQSIVGATPGPGPGPADPLPAAPADSEATAQAAVQATTIRSEQETLDLFLRHPAMDALVGAFSGRPLSVIPEGAPAPGSDSGDRRE
ncbi:MAG TPA: DNA polymerase III subunit gamma/tau [Myxococcota bacterium]|mgnify:CR=1 FL=1|nr:DNA polymerase III subunit gamma/tau [Myxococcota bacterium]HQK52210.1 DNA polymerase III subunit gamma/tau [Myxococcota bacterium]